MFLGGQLIILVFSLDYQGQYLPSSHNYWFNIFSILLLFHLNIIIILIIKTIIVTESSHAQKTRLIWQYLCVIQHYNLIYASINAQKNLKNG